MIQPTENSIGANAELILREDYFCQQFTKYLLKLSDVHDDFEAGGKTEEKETKKTKVTGFVCSLLGGAAGYGVGTLAPSLATILVKAGYTSAGVLATEISKWKETSDERNTRRKIFISLPQDQRMREESTEIFIPAALALFRAYECQFSNVTDAIEGSWRLAMSKLADDAAERVINYITELSAEERQSFCQRFTTYKTPANIWGAPAAIYNAVLFGKSNQSLGDVLRFNKSGHTLMYWFGENMKEKQKMETNHLFDDVGYSPQGHGHGTFWFWKKKDGCLHKVYGYRRCHKFDKYFNARKYKPVETNDEENSLPLHQSFISYEYKLDLNVTRADVERVLQFFRKEDPRLDNLYAGMADILGDVVNELRLICKTGAETNVLVKQMHNCLKSMVVLQEGGDAGKESRFTFGLPEKIVNFTGRVSALENLHITISHQNIDNVTVITTVSGLGGIGKTTLAIHYAWTYSKFYHNIIWINSQNLGSIRDSINKLVDELKIITVDRQGNEIGLEDVAKLIYDHFPGDKTLLIFDNVENYEGIKGFLPKASPDQPAPFVLMTSRNKAWNDKVKMIELDVFDPKESLDFLISYLELENEQEFERAKEIAELLQNLPLGIRQAGAYIKVQCQKLKESKEKQLKEYIDLFNSKKVKLLLGFRHSKQTLDQNESTTLVTWNITLKKIKKENPMSKNIMQYISCLSPNNIPKQLFLGVPRKLIYTPMWSFLQARKYEYYDVMNSISLLSDYSMITWDTNEFFNVHRLVQKVIQLKMRKGKLISVIETLVDIFKFSLKNNESEENQNSYLVHAETLLNFRKQLIFIDKYKELRDLILSCQSNAIDTQINLVIRLIERKQLRTGIAKSKEFRLDWFEKSQDMHRRYIKKFVEHLTDIRPLNWSNSNEEFHIFLEFLEEVATVVEHYETGYPRYGDLCQVVPIEIIESLTSIVLKYANSLIIESKHKNHMLANLLKIFSTYNHSLEKKCPYNRSYFLLVDSVIQTLNGCADISKVQTPNASLGALGPQRLSLVMSLVRIIRCEKLIERDGGADWVEWLRVTTILVETLYSPPIPKPSTSELEEHFSNVSKSLEFCLDNFRNDKITLDRVFNKLCELRALIEDLYSRGMFIFLRCDTHELFYLVRKVSTEITCGILKDSLLKDDYINESLSLCKLISKISYKTQLLSDLEEIQEKLEACKNV